MPPQALSHVKAALAGALFTATRSHEQEDQQETKS
jgi:hypothetical protein